MCPFSVCDWWICPIPVHFLTSEKDDDEGDKRDEPRDNSEESSGNLDKSSGPWNRSAPTQTPVVEAIGKFLMLA